MSAKSSLPVGVDAIQTKGWLRAYKFLIARRVSQAGFLLLFLIGPWFGIWWLKGNLAGSVFLDIIPFTDPFVLLQSLAANHWPELTAFIGALIIITFYGLVGGRVYCSWICPINPITDLANWLHRKLNLPKGWQPKEQTRVFLMVMVLAVSFFSGTIAWEFINPISIVHRGLIFGGGLGWAFVIAVFLFDMLLSRRGWCGHLCPVGAFYGALGAKSMLRVSASKRSDCNDCMDCFAVCPEMQVITPALRGNDEDTSLILSHDCTNCGRCIDVCAADVFQFTHRFDTRPSKGRMREKSKLAPSGLRGT